jgi:hypothetical protein
MIHVGYLGFAELQYVHMPLPGEKLVVFLSDGAFEEQRGSDWAPRWWRAEDCGLVAPIMISNGRRIDQRTTMSQQGGVDWFCRHLELNGFDPIVFDGRDPAAFLWAILEIEARLAAAGEISPSDDLGTDNVISDFLRLLDNSVQHQSIAGLQSRLIRSEAELAHLRAEIWRDVKTNHRWVYRLYRKELRPFQLSRSRSI